MARLYRQAAVIPFRIRNARVEVALVTTAGGKRWVVPKGSLDEGEESADAAIRETEEEAGLLGDLEPEPMGRYRFTRNRDRYEVDVYLMHVTVVLDYWTEARLRHRRWMAVEDAAALVRADLQPFVRAAEQLLNSVNGHHRARRPAPRRMGTRGRHQP